MLRTTRICANFSKKFVARAFSQSEGGYLATGWKAKAPRPPKVLITGASGQIGMELTPYLREFYGTENVIASDVKQPPASLAENGPFQYLDVLEAAQLSRLVVEENVKTIVHLAAILSAVGERHPALDLKINNQGTENVFDVAIKNGCKVFCPSTIAAFGPSTPKENTPVDCIMRPTTMYGITKVFSELMGEYYMKKYGLDYRSIRYPGVISAKAPPGGGTTDYAVEIYTEALLNKKYTCFLHENTALPMMYMPDLLKATFQLIEAEPAKLKRRVYNLGSMSFTPKELAVSIRRHIPEFKLECIPDFRQAIADSWPKSIDDSESSKDWGWKPTYNIDTMTDAMFEYLREKHNMKA